MKKIRPLSIYLLFACLSLGLNYGFGQGDVEVDGNVKINYTTGQSPATMLTLERFNPATSSTCTLGGSPTSSTNSWSFTLSDKVGARCSSIFPFPFGSLAFGGHNYMDFSYNGTTVSSITDEGKHIRPATGTADLLPYAYGHIEASSTNVLAGTNNYTIVRTDYGADIIFNQNVARQLVINATPTLENSQVILLRKNVTGTAVDEIVIGYPFQGETGTNAQATINVFLNDSSGNPRNDASFSFIAYKPN